MSPTRTGAPRTMYPNTPHVFDLSTGIPRVPISEEARQLGASPPDLVVNIIKHLHTFGIVVLENAIDKGHVEALNAILEPEAKQLAKTPGRHFNFGAETGNINQGPPLAESLMFPDIWANPFVLSVMAAMLGPEPVLHFANGNTAVQTGPGGRQPVHSDIDFPHPTFPFSFVVNIPLVDMTAENGGLEVWPGTHTSTTFSDQVMIAGQHGRAILPELLRKREAISPPVQAVSPKGSIIIRDLRLWHAGRPNLTPNPRAMLAFGWQAAWWRGEGEIKLPAHLHPLIESWERGPIKFRVAAKITGVEADGLEHGAKANSFASSETVIAALFS